MVTECEHPSARDRRDVFHRRSLPWKTLPFFHRTPELAILVGGVVEEAAQAGLNAASIGAPVEIPEELRAAALQRAMTFEDQGTLRP